MSPVAVTGVHRSGTSLVARMMRSAGLYLGDDHDLLDPAPDNPEGFFEHAGFVRLDEELLGATGGAWDHPPACGPMAADDPRVDGLRGEAGALVARLAAYDPWGWKDPRTSLTARFWLDLIPDVRFVLCLRHPLEVALSLKERNQASYVHALSLWRAYYLALLDSVPEGRRIVTHYDAYFDHESTEIERLLEFAELSHEGTARARANVRPQLRHHRLDVALADAGVDSATIDLYRQLCEEAGRPAEHDASPLSSAPLRHTTIELARTKHDLERRKRQVGSLERQRAELEGRVAQLEAAGNASLIGQMQDRIDRIEDAVHQVRYQLEDRTGRLDAGVVRGCRDLVRSHVGHQEDVVVVAKGDPSLLDLYGRPTSNFPQNELGTYPGFALATSTAAVAHLEALRLRGARFFLLPETSAWWLGHFSAFAEHLVGHYEVVAEQAGAGLLVDLRTKRDLAGGWSQAISEVVDRIGIACTGPPAVLDWTGLDLASALPGYNTFLPPPGDDHLPYLDDTVDVVVIDSASRLDEARRAGRLAVVSVVQHGVRTVVETVEVLAPHRHPSMEIRLAVVVPSGDPDPTWLGHLREALRGQADVEVLLAPEPAVLAATAAQADLVALIDEGVLPLPGCVAAVSAILRHRERCGAVAVKLFSPDGALEAAGTEEFADGSSGAVASGAFDVDASWHDFVRETGTGRGLTVFAPAALKEIGADILATLESPLWCGRLWAAGLGILYQPEAAAVRALPARPRRGLSPEMSAVWHPSLERRPVRPAVLDEGAWRRLIAVAYTEAERW